MKRFKQNKGFTGVELILSILIIAISISIIGTILNNIYLGSQSINRQVMSLSYIINIIQNIEAMEYGQVNNDTMVAIIGNMRNSLSIPEAYEISCNVSRYSDTSIITAPMDLIKVVEINIRYKVGNAQESISVSMLKKERLYI